MRRQHVINLLTVLVAAGAWLASWQGLFSTGGPGPHTVVSLHGREVVLHGYGVYQLESVAMAAQGKAQDLVTAVLGVPLLLVATVLARRGSLRGKLLLAGTLAYFLYTYTLYTFLVQFNPLFLLYVALMGASLYAFVLTMTTFDLAALPAYFDQRLPVRFIGGFLVVTGAAVGLLWLGMLVPPMLQGTVPAGLEHYTTMVVQGLDLGVVIPTVILAGILLARRRPWGYLLGVVMTVKLFTMLVAITAMVAWQAAVGVAVRPVETGLFSSLALVTAYCLLALLRGVREPA
ncbi:MAG: hypothetical protein QHH05_09955 [Syntrophomonadaceae bacterium]|jgi:hypothetical protein|nr:hypothetical protein [Syntrophomonadaceae bacterium]MDH7498750.1 hypothetical protein [Syntrophomonadaceae bacterium]